MPNALQRPQPGQKSPLRCRVPIVPFSPSCSETLSGTILVEGHFNIFAAQAGSHADSKRASANPLDGAFAGNAPEGKIFTFLNSPTPLSALSVLGFKAAREELDEMRALSVSVEFLAACTQLEQIARPAPSIASQSQEDQWGLKTVSMAAAASRSCTDITVPTPTMHRSPTASTMLGSSHERLALSV